jgi:hypothetical protein
MLTSASGVLVKDTIKGTFVLKNTLQYMNSQQVLS